MVLTAAVSTGARYSWSAMHMHHRGARIRCDITTDRAGQLEMCGAAVFMIPRDMSGISQVLSLFESGIGMGYGKVGYGFRPSKESFQ